jgi:ACS family hexuronate transporter-like MFS transporter
MTPTPQDVSAKPPVSNWTTNLGVLAAAHAVGAMTFPAVAAMAPLIRADLALSAMQVGFIVTAYSATQSIFGLPIGTVIDRIGVRRALVVANLMVAVGTLLMSFAGAFSAAVFALAVTGLGYGFVNPSTSKGVFDWFPAHRRGTAMGIKQTGVPIGGLIGAGAGAIAAFYPWRMLLHVMAGCAILSALAALLLPRGPTRDAGTLRFGVLADIRSVLADRNLNIFNLGVGIYQAGQFNFLTYITLFMREAVQASQPLAAACLGIAQVASAVGRLGWGAVSDSLFRGRRKPVLVMIGATGTVGLVIFSLLTPGWGVPLGVALTVIIGMTVPGYVALVQTIVVETAEPRLAATAVGYNRLYTAMGAALGPPIFGATVDLTRGYRFGWIVTAVIVLVATLLVGRFFRERADARSGSR